MAKDPHQFFKTPTDYERWEPYILQCNHIDGFSLEQQDRAKQALEYLQKYFGKGFLKRAKRSGHQLLPLLINATAARRTAVVELGESLEALQYAENFKRILKLIKTEATNRQTQEEQFNEGYSTIKIGYAFLKAGFTVHFIDDKGSRKRPDIKLIDEETGQEILIEVSTLVRSDRLLQANRASHPIWNLFFCALGAANLIMYAEMKEGFDQDQANTAVDQLKKITEEVKLHQELRTLVNDYIVAGIAPNDKIEQLDKWAMEVRISKNIVGPPVFFNELARVMRKIKEKVEQLPKEKIGIIFIPLLTSFLFYIYDLKVLLNEIEKQINDYPNLLAVVLSNGYTEEYFGNVQAETLTPSITMKTTESGILGPMVIIENRSLALSISNGTLTKFRKAFR